MRAQAPCAYYSYMCYSTVRLSGQHLRHVRRGGGLAVGGRHARTVGVVLDRVVQGLGHHARGPHLEHAARRPVLVVELEPDQRRVAIGADVVAATLVLALVPARLFLASRPVAGPSPVARRPRGPQRNELFVSVFVWRAG